MRLRERVLFNCSTGPLMEHERNDMKETTHSETVPNRRRLRHVAFTQDDFLKPVKAIFTSTSTKWSACFCLQPNQSIFIKARLNLIETSFVFEVSLTLSAKTRQQEIGRLNLN